MHCQPDCVKPKRNDETALSSDVGLYMKFNVTPEGRPTGCEGLDEAWLNGHSVFTGKVTCPKEDYAPEGIPLHQLVESMADDQQLFMEVYIAAHEKMIANGYDETDLEQAPSDKWVYDW